MDEWCGWVMGMWYPLDITMDKRLTVWINRETEKDKDL